MPCIGSTSPRCTTSRSTSSATITRPRTPPSARSCRPSPGSTGSRSVRGRKTDHEASTFRIWLFRIARNVVAERRRGRRRRPEAPLDLATTALRSGRRRGNRGRARGGHGGAARGRRPDRRPPPGGRPALRPRDVDRGDRRDPRPLRGRGPRAHPSGPAPRRRRAPRRWIGIVGERRARPAGRRDRGLHRRPLPRIAPRAPAARRRRRCPLERARRCGRAGRRPSALPPVVPLRGVAGRAAGGGPGRAAGPGELHRLPQSGRRGRCRRRLGRSASGPRSSAAC